MKRKEGTAVDQKVIIAHKNGVSDEVKAKVQHQYPHALIKVISTTDIIKEAIEYKKKVDRVVYMPEITTVEAEQIACCWPGCIPVAVDKVSSSR